MHTQARTHARTHASTQARKHARTRARTHTHTHTCIQAHTHTHTITHTHTHTAIVNAADEAMQHYGGVAGAIVAAGGDVIQKESDEWVAKHGRYIDSHT